MGEMQYHMIQVGDTGIGGFRTLPSGTPSHWMSYLSVADVDATVKAAQQAGAQVLMPPTDFPPVGRGATIADPTGAVLSVWKSAQEDRADSTPVKFGDWYWNECLTTDGMKALAFYEKVFGYTHDSMDMGPQGTYYILKKDAIPRGGLMQPKQSMPSAWVPYVHVSECDASEKKAKSLGASVLMPSTDIPNVGRFAVLQDPTGAVISIIRGQAAK